MPHCVGLEPHGVHAQRVVPRRADLCLSNEVCEKHQSSGTPDRRAVNPRADCERRLHAPFRECEESDGCGHPRGDVPPFHADGVNRVNHEDQCGGRPHHHGWPVAQRWNVEECDRARRPARHADWCGHRHRDVHPRHRLAVGCVEEERTEPQCAPGEAEYKADQWVCTELADIRGLRCWNLCWKLCRSSPQRKRVGHRAPESPRAHDDVDDVRPGIGRLQHCRVGPARLAVPVRHGSVIRRPDVRGLQLDHETRDEECDERQDAR